MYKEFHYISRSGWGKGPWDKEPDKIEFLDAETGIPCVILRHPETGHLCGYAGVDFTHPLYKCEREKIDNSIIGCVHGGVTYSDLGYDSSEYEQGGLFISGPDKDLDIWWFGFDCGHGGDGQPALKQHYLKPLKYRDVEYVKNNLKDLAKSLFDPLCAEMKPFRKQIAAEPGNKANYLVFADWLEENNRLKAAEYLRRPEKNTGLSKAQQDYVDRVNEYLKGCEAVSVGGCRGCEECGIPEDAENYFTDDFTDEWFSWNECEICKGIAGNRQPWHCVINGEIVHGSCCTDCVMYLANGDVPQNPE